MIGCKSGAILFFIDQFKYNISGKTVMVNDRLYPYVDIYYFSKFPQWEIGLGVLAQNLYYCLPNIFYFLFVLREHNSAPKWLICN
jgi:hypothetical protein